MTDEIITWEDIDDDQIVYRTSSTSRMCVHVDRDCQLLSRANRIHEREARCYHDDIRLCRNCTGRADDPKDRYSRDYYQALKAAAKSDD